MSNASHLIGRECGVERHISIFKRKGIWLGRQKPKVGDIVTFDWQGHSTGWADHIGIVEKVNGNMITTIEGNTGRPLAVRRKSYPWNSNVIKGYARPHYNSTSHPKHKLKDLDTIAKEVIDGNWGNNPERVKKLAQAGYDAVKVQEKVNKLIKDDETKEVVRLAEEQPVGGEQPEEGQKDNILIVDGTVYDIKKRGK